MKVRSVVPVALAVLLLAGCGGSSGGTASPSAASSVPSSSDPTTEPTTQAPAGDATSVALASTSLGDVLVGPNGMTLYMFDPDKQGASTCYDQCAAAWPPLTVDGAPTAADGLDAALLGTTQRTDGTMQVTYNKWPLYYWVKDAAAGDVTGQAVNDVWWVLDSTGTPVRTKP